MTAKAAFSDRWTETAEEDLAGIVDYIAAENPDSALTIFERICRYAADLRTLPQRGRIVPELHRFGIANYRELLPTPWRIIYRIEEGTVFVIAVLDGRRGLEDSLLERVGRR